MNNNTNNDRRRNESPHSSSTSNWVYGAAAAAAIGLGAYLFSGRNNAQAQQHTPAIAQARNQLSDPETSDSEPESNPRNDSASSFLTDMVSRVLSVSTQSCNQEGEHVLPEPVITNLNSLLDDIHVRFIKLKEFPLHYKVFDTIFNDLHKKMKDVDPYYRKYASTVQFAGSHFDNLRIEKPDEFDMDIVIGLPLNINSDMFNPAQSDINLEAKAPGFVQLKMGTQFQRLPMRDNEEWLNNKAAFEWKDGCNYLLRDKFIDWFKSVVTRALNKYEVTDNHRRPIIYVAGVPYIIHVSESGPAKTLLIRNESRNFKMDVDLVPALKFPENRWPVSRSYRNIPPECKKDYWMVVPKPNKESEIVQDQSRSWRIALHNQERELLYKTNHLRQALRLIKKLRNSQNMDKIASYYIKTLFFWEIIEINDISYWNNCPAVLFKRMVAKLHQALVIGKIPYFWHQGNNLIGSVPRETLNQYARKLVPLMEVLEDPTKYKLVAKYLLTPQEFIEYNARYLHT